MSDKTCCNSSVGVLIFDSSDRLLMFTRPDGKGIAPVAGHIWDAHESAEAAAVAEAREEVGLTVTNLEKVTGGWRWNRCKRRPGTLGYGHMWTILRATSWHGDLNPSTRETRDVRWYTAPEIQELAKKTACFAGGPRPGHGLAQWQADPGLESVWVNWLHIARVITVPCPARAVTDAFAVHGTPHA